MLKDFIKYISDNKLFESNQRILLAVSGGVDSMVLLHLFYESGFSFGVVHCNFNLRGNESDTDELFVKDFINSHGLELFSKSFDTESYAKLNSISIEMAARQLRYAFFEEVRIQHNYDYIATAHHQDDVIETFLINLIRKTGIRGLTGIKPKAEKIIRPLLFSNRKQIVEYSFDKEIMYREDSSNNTIVFRRNFIRHNILPQFDKLFPSSRENIIASISHLKEVEYVFKETIASEKQKVVSIKDESVYINIDKLIKSKFSKTLLFEILFEYHFNSAVVNEVFDKLNEGSGKKFYSSDFRLVKDRNYLIISKLKDNDQGNIYIDEDDMELYKPIKLRFSKIDSKGFKIPSSKHIACLDFDKLDFPLIIKRWQQGEYFQPLGMVGFKKLSDFFIDEKMSIPEKENTSILFSGPKIIWIIGKRIDNRFKITQNTKTIYQIEYIPNA